MSRTKKIVFALGIVALVGVIVYFLYKKQPTPPPPNLPKPKGDLQLLQVVPPEGKNKTIFTSTGIQFSFDNPLILSSVEVIISPPIKIITDTARNSSKILVIRPAGQWQTGINYTITIKKGLLSNNNNELKEDIIYEVEFEVPEDLFHY